MIWVFIARVIRDYVPTYLYETYLLGDTPTDDRFACVSGTDRDTGHDIGRLCVKTSADTNNMFQRFKRIEATAPAGRHGPGALSYQQIMKARLTVTSIILLHCFLRNITAQKVLLSTYGNVTLARNDLFNKINAGSLITNYTGHGSVDNWADRIFV